MKIRNSLLIFSMLAGVLAGCQMSEDLLGGALDSLFLNREAESAGTNNGSPGSMFKDNFSTQDNGWGTAVFVEGRTEFFNDGFRIQVDRDYYLLWSTPGKEFDNVRLDVDVNLIGGGVDNTYGLICRYENSDNFYAFLISSDGYYAIRKRTGGGGLEILTGNEYQFSEIISMDGQGNHLTALCEGNRLELFVNGELVAQAVDSDLSRGDIGLIAGTFSAEATDLFFDNFAAAVP